VYDDNPEDTGNHEQGVSAVVDIAGSVSEGCTSEETTKQADLEVGLTGGEELDDQKSFSSVSGLTADSDSTSLSGSLLEELEDFEEAHIGWALQNVITYQKASRIKRTSRMWVLEKDGQRWEEEDLTNVKNVLRPRQL
jgi:hypothetical protein